MTSEVTYFPEALASPSEGAVDLMQGVFIFMFRRAAHLNASRDTARSWIVQVTDHGAFDRRRHLNTRHIRSHMGLLRDVQRCFIELCVNLRTPAYKLLVNPAPNQRHSSNISDYNVAYIVKKTLLNALVNKSAFLPGAVL